MCWSKGFIVCLTALVWAMCVTEQVWVTLKPQGHLERWKDPSREAAKPLHDFRRLQEGAAVSRSARGEAGEGRPVPRPL